MLIARHERGEPTRLVDEMAVPCSAGAPYWEAFNELRDQRDSGFGLGSLRLEAVIAWLDEQRIFDPVERDRYRFHLTELDRELRELHSKADKKENKASTDPNDPRASRRVG